MKKLSEITKFGLNSIHGTQLYSPQTASNTLAKQLEGVGVNPYKWEQPFQVGLQNYFLQKEYNKYKPKSANK